MRWLACLVLVASCGDNIHVMTPDELSAAYTDVDCRYWVGATCRFGQDCASGNCRGPGSTCTSETCL